MPRPRDESTVPPSSRGIEPASHYWARRAVKRAVYHGVLPPVQNCPCFDCGGFARKYDHYLGYEKIHWLDVQPVCDRCHAKREFSRGVLRLPK